MAVLQPGEAWRRIEERLGPLPEETIERRAAGGRVLTRRLEARVDVPAADVSAMDGYALPGEVSPGESRPVSGAVAAGDPPGFELAPPAVARIMTGAPLPVGADRVVPVEETDAGRETVIFLRPSLAGQHVRRRGEILKIGDPLLAA
ncbi:MAG TPA: molybdopterin molybdenumtransferase MoeA, partial [Thermoanaerobaculia bacterium]|nr:molybdopterin molybdenumtransferase MoeA [Thermoanaerobaculia bacterium]